MNHPDAFSGDRFNALDGWTNATELCQPLQNCGRYRLTMQLNFDFIPDAPGTEIPIVVGFVDDVLDLDFHPYAYQNSFPVDLIVPALGSGWIEEVLEFYFCGQPADILNIERSDWHFPEDQIHIDNVSIRLVPAPLLVNAGPDLSLTAACTSGACVDLAAVLNVLSGCEFTYSWAPSTGLNDPNIAAPTACPTSTTTYTVTVSDACGNVATDEVIVVVIQTGCLTITKTVNDTYTYSGAPVVYTITVCNNSGTLETVTLDEDVPDNFVTTNIVPVWPNYPSTPLAVDVPASGCVTVEITGYFTALSSIEDPYINCVTATPALETPLIACAEAVIVMQSCPLVVLGEGDCVNGPVEMCLGIHSLIADVKTANFRWVFPSFLDPPSSFSGATVPAVANGIDPSSTISAEQPWPGSPGSSYVDIHLVYNDPLTSTSGIYSLLCIDFILVGPVTPLINQYPTFATTALPPIQNNRVELLDSGGLPLQPNGFWTQPAGVILYECPGLVGPDASFVIDQVLCTGEISVTGAFSHPNAIHMWTWGDERTTPVNGAQAYTYNYYEPITMNTDWPLNPPIPPAPPGTYTITHTVILDGVASTSSQSVTLFTCCAAGTVVPDGTMASGGLDGFGPGTVDIQGEYIVDVNVVVSNAQLFMEPGSEIIVKNGATLDIRDATLRSCNGVMWRSITVEAGGTLYIARSYVDDAENAVKALDGAVGSTKENQFHNNRVGIHVPAPPGNVQNSITLGSKNNQFYSAGPMPAPYPGQTTTIGATGYAAFDIQRVPLYLNVGWNVFHHLSNGIVADRCDITLRDCSFHYIAPDATYAALVGNGAAIHARATKGWYTLDQVGSFVNGLTPFRECRYGAYTSRMNVYSSANRMELVGTAYHVEKSGSREVHLFHNELDTKYNGIELFFNDEASRLIVEDNTITFGSAPYVGGPKMYTAIQVEENNGNNPRSVIRNNTITFRSGVITAHTGIKLTATSDYLVATNVLHMTDNSTNYAGIQLLGCADTEVSCNTVNGASEMYPEKGQAAIRNVKGRRPYISCNDVNKTTNGLLFSGESYGADVRGNHIRKHKWGLHLDGTAIIDVQTLKGNLWYNAAAAGGIEALYEVSDLLSIQSQFRVDPITIGAGVTWPPNWSPPQWFQPAFGATYDCSNDHHTDYCEQFGREKCDKCLNGLDARIAADSLENDPYTEQTQWTLKGDLYDKLDEAPELRDSLPDLEAFYAAMQNGVIAHLKLVEDERGSLALVDSTVAATLKENQQQMAVIMDLVKTTMAQLDDSTLTTAQRQAIATTLAGYQQNIHDLAEYNATVVELARDTKVLTAEGVRAANTALGDMELTETNAKQVNEVYLATIGKEVDGFTADQTSALFAIANQCPMVGGNAVFRARALYTLIDDAQQYDDELLCLQHGIIVKSLHQQKLASLSVIPNPAMDEATLLLSEALNGTAVFIVYDAVGAEVLRHNLPTETPRYAFSTATLAPGMYHYKVLSTAGVFGDGKLTIVR